MQAQELADAQAKGRPGSLQAQLDGHEETFAAPAQADYPTAPPAAPTQADYPTAPPAAPTVPAQAGPYGGQHGYGQDAYGQPAYAQGAGPDNGYAGGYEGQYDMPQYDQHGQQQPYPTQHDPAGTGQQPAYDTQAQYAQSLDETSFFDTSLIDVRQFQQDGGR
jgi:hypothetical protein